MVKVAGDVCGIEGLACTHDRTIFVGADNVADRVIASAEFIIDVKTIVYWLENITKTEGSGSESGIRVDISWIATHSISVRLCWVDSFADKSTSTVKVVILSLVDGQAWLINTGEIGWPWNKAVLGILDQNVELTSVNHLIAVVVIDWHQLLWSVVVASASEIGVRDAVDIARLEIAGESLG